MTRSLFFYIGLAVELLHGFGPRASVSGYHAYGTSATKGNRGHGKRYRHGGGLILCAVSLMLLRNYTVYTVTNVGRSRVFSYGRHLNFAFVKRKLSVSCLRNSSVNVVEITKYNYRITLQKKSVLASFPSCLEQ